MRPDFLKDRLNYLGPKYNSTFPQMKFVSTTFHKGSWRSSFGTMRSLSQPLDCFFLNVSLMCYGLEFRALMILYSLEL